MSEISTHSAKTAIAGRNNSGSFPARVPSRSLGGVTGTSIRKDGARSLKGVPVEIKHGHRSTGGDAVQRVARMASPYPKYLMLTFEQLRKSGGL